ncbi:hypothetical protein BGX23_000451 [Mortierella sp. AD031]|nr:hypothetical protein BGX23_000451 [Mortierella sp. AD031]KAG0217921.1 hypothetical protein BGX33_009082 [Mortierella sp. NVP41]
MELPTTSIPRQPQQQCQEQKQKPLPLRSLVFKNIEFRQLALETFLTTTPNLEELKVIAYAPPFSFTQRFLYDSLDFLRHVRSLDLKLTSFHFSVKGRSYPESDEHEALLNEIAPWTSDYLVSNEDFTLVNLMSIQSVPNVIISLELAGKRDMNGYGLLDYLHVSPHLLHLKAPYTAILISLLLFQIASHPSDSEPEEIPATVASSSNTPSYYARVWACRKIRLLHIGFCAGGAYEVTSPASSRFIFGYISRVCPLVQDLEVRAFCSHNIYHSDREGPLCMRLDGGFCLLTRLQHLQRLRIGAFDSLLKAQSWDLDWMVTAGQTQLRRNQRRQIVKHWTNSLDGEAARHLEPKHEWVHKFSETIDPEDELSRYYLRLDQVRLLKDVETILAEMDTDEFKCWPNLRKLSLYNENRFGLPLQEEIQRLFPESDSPPDVYTPGHFLSKVFSYLLPSAI